MSRLFRVVFTHECTCTHHKLALDALRHIRCEQAPQWMNLFLKHFDAYLEGSTDPDRKFRDFRNHVLHVDEGNWGGAREAARTWYDTTVAELRARRWRKAVYAAGVLSHYYTDPIQPLHTAQTEAELPIHRALERSVEKTYGELQNILEEDFGGYPDFDAPSSDDWLEQMVIDGARAARSHYDTLIDHYNLDQGVRNPANGLDQELRDCLAQLIGRATVGFSRILEQAFEEAGVEPPPTRITLMGYLATLSIPIAWVTRLLSDRRQRAEVLRIYRELQRTGRVDKSLPPSEREVRRLHAEEILGSPPEQPAEQLADQPADQPAEGGTRESGARYGQGAEPRKRSTRPVTKIVRPLSRIEGTGAADSAEPTPAKHARYYLQPQSDVVEAPSIGSKTARRLKKIGLTTVSELLTADCDEAARQINANYIDAPTLANWQAEARFVCRTPHLRGYGAQILVACDFREPEDLAGIDPVELLPLVEAFIESPEGQRVLHAGKKPDLAELRRWVQWAGQARELPSDQTAYELKSA